MQYVGLRNPIDYKFHFVFPSFFIYFQCKLRYLIIEIRLFRIPLHAQLHYYLLTRLIRR